MLEGTLKGGAVVDARTVEDTETVEDTRAVEDTRTVDWTWTIEKKSASWAAYCWPRHGKQGSSVAKETEVAHFDWVPVLMVKLYPLTCLLSAFSVQVVCVTSLHQ